MRRVLAAWLLLCGQACALTPPQAPTPPATATTAGTVPNLGGFGGAALSSSLPVWAPISIRETYPNNFSSAIDSKRASQTTRLWTQLSARSAASAVRICWANFGGVAGAYVTEGDNGNTLVVSGSVEVNPTQAIGTWNPTSNSGAILIPVFFNGQRTTTIGPSGAACSDPLVYPFSAGQNIYIRTFYSANGSGSFPVLRGSSGLANFTESINNGYFAGIKISTSTTPTTSISGTTISSNGFALPLIPGSLAFYGGSLTGYVYDNGSGALVAGNGVTAGTVNYTSGAVTMTLTNAAAPNAISLLGYGSYGAGVDDTLNVAPTTYTTATPTSGLYGPSLILGLLPSTSSIAPAGLCAYGDSIVFGSGNATEIGQSWVTYSSSQIGVYRAGQPSETAAAFAQGNYSRRRFSLVARQCSRVLENYGTNDDFSVNFNLSQFQTAKLAIWAELAAIMPHGYKDIYPVSILPRTVSAASQTPLNSNFGPGTVASGTPSLRNAENAWMCSQVSVLGLGGFIDTASAIEGNAASCTGAGDGTWKNLNLTLDGTHPNYLGNMTIAGAIGYGGTNPSQAFAP